MEGTIPRFNRAVCGYFTLGVQPISAGILMSEGVCCQEETFRGSPGALRIRSQTP
jgi:hypothetical protein